MTAAERELVRAAVDRARRSELDTIAAQLAGIMFCRGCGMELEHDWTPGCSHCWQRWRPRVKAGEPLALEHHRRVAEYAEHRRAERKVEPMEGTPTGRQPARSWKDSRRNFGVDWRVAIPARRAA